MRWRHSDELYEHGTWRQEQEVPGVPEGVIWQVGDVGEWTRDKTTGILGMTAALSTIAEPQFPTPNMVITLGTCYEVPHGIMGLLEEWDDVMAALWEQ